MKTILKKSAIGTGSVKDRTEKGAFRNTTCSGNAGFYSEWSVTSWAKYIEILPPCYEGDKRRILEQCGQLKI